MFRSFVLSVFLGGGTLFAGSPTSVVTSGGEEGEAAGFDSRLTGDWGAFGLGWRRRG